MKTGITAEIIINKSIEYGLILFAIGSPFSISIAQIGFIFALFLWIIKLLFIRPVKWQNSFIDVFILMFIMGCVLSSLLSIDPLISLKANHNLWLIFLMYLLLNNLDFKKGINVLKILLVVSVVIGIYGIIQSLTGIDIEKSQPLIKYGNLLYGAWGFFGLHLTFGGYQMMIGLILLSISLFGLSKMKLKYKILISISTIIVILSTIGSFARTAWVGLIGGIFIFGFLGILLKSKKIIITIFIISLVIIVIITTFPDIRQRIISIITDLKFSARSELWRGAFEMIKDNKFFGVGAGMFQKYFLQYQPKIIDAYGHPHNDFLAIYLRSGLLGFIGYMLMYIFYFIKMISLSKFLYKENKLYFSIVLGLMVSIFAFLIAGWGQNYFTDSENAMLLWFIFGVSMIFYYKCPNIVLKKV